MLKKLLPAAAAILLSACGNTVPQSSNYTTDEPAETTSVTETVTEAETAEPTTVPEPEPSAAEKLLETLTLEEKVCQMFIVTPEQLTGGADVLYIYDDFRDALNELPVGGIVLFEKNLESKDQTMTLLSQAQECAREACGIGLFTAIDEEGGGVARAANKLGTTAFYNMRYYGDENSSETAYNIGYTIGSELFEIGFNLDFAPVADVNLNPANELGNRIFSSDPQVVSNMVSNVVMGLQDAGVCSTLKHFPGLGAEGGNTHNDSSVVLYRTLDELRNAEFIPFSDGIKAGADFVMVGHHTVTGIGDNMPADLSYKAVTELLRNELCFEGIAVTDSQQMNTIVNIYSSGEAAVLSVKAGIDIILMPKDLREAVTAVCGAVRSGEISEERIDESLIRILECKYKYGIIEEGK